MRRHQYLVGVCVNPIGMTGTTTITAFGTIQAGSERTLVFDGVLTLTYNATSLILPGSANITTAAGDVAIMRSEGSGNWRCISYNKASGSGGGGTGLTFSTITTNITALSGAGYICNSASRLTITLPLSPNIGDAITVVGSGSGGFLVSPNTGQSIWNGSVQSSAGFNGTSSSTIGLVYESLNTWITLYSTGSITVPSVAGDPFWNNVTFLLPGNGSYQDFSGNGLNVSATNTSFSTAVTKFTGNSIAFNGTTSGITYGVNNAFKFAGDFCVEGWFYFNSVSAAQTLFHQQSVMTSGN